MNTRSLRIWLLATSTLLISATLVVIVPSMWKPGISVEKTSLVEPRHEPEDEEQSSEVVLTIFTDLQCPACAAVNTYLNTLEDKYAGRVKFEYKHFPLSQHKNALKAAMAVEAAGRQGKSDEMRDNLFEIRTHWAQSSVPEIHFNSIAKRLELDLDQFSTDSKDQELLKKIAKDFYTGLASEVNSTPTIFFNGEKIVGMSKEDFINKIEEALNAQQ